MEQYTELDVDTTLFSRLSTGLVSPGVVWALHAFGAGGQTG